jgi:UDP-N-acetylmuramoyl-L-alanyl-D-glutamate--2,6-diaminopimelate ligase
LSERADVRPSGDIGHEITGLSFPVTMPSGTLMARSPLMGRHNIYNILSAIGIGTALGLSADVIALGIKNMKAVPGRMEKVDEGQSFSVFVDYAHTEDALLRLLEAVREVAPKRVITLFGCGGDRDRTKRPKMGKAALKGSDIVVVTSDNPRSEDPEAIIREVEAGMAEEGVRMSSANARPEAASRKKPYFVIPDRGEAVEIVVRMAKPGDVVVLAGKGPEDYQIIGDRKIHFDDREAAREAIRKYRRVA